jgi:general secretion pathway protein J
MHARSVRSIQSGFTLIELLLALGIVAFIMTMVYAGLQTALRAADSGEAQIDRTSKVRVTHEFLRHQLSRILPLSFEQDQARNIAKVFEATRNKIRYVGPMPGYLGRGGPYVQELELAGGQLLFRHWLLNGFDPQKIDRKVKPLLLLDGIASGEFAFRKIEREGKVGRWESQWEESQSTPVMIRLKLRFKPEMRLFWPDLETPTLVDANVNRQFFQAQPSTPGEIQ